MKVDSIDHCLVYVGQRPTATTVAALCKLKKSGVLLGQGTAYDYKREGRGRAAHRDRNFLANGKKLEFY